MSTRLERLERLATLTAALRDKPGGEGMTAGQRTMVAHLLPIVERAVPETAVEARAALILLKSILTNSHGAASHAPRRGRTASGKSDVDAAHAAYQQG